jgi:hypothetical protein
MNNNQVFPCCTSDIPVREIVEHLTTNIGALCECLLPVGRRAGAEYRCNNVQGEPGKSLGVRLTGAKAGVWCDFANGSAGDPLDLVQACLGLNKGEAVHWAKNWLGFGDGAHVPSRSPSSSPHDEAPRKDHTHHRIALAIWRSSQPAAGTFVETFLRSRGITIPIPPTIRYHPTLLNTDTGHHLPSMVAAVQGSDGQIQAVHRTYIRSDGKDKADVPDPRMAMAPTKGGAVNLSPTTNRVWLTEGIEDGLAMMQMMREPAWAVLGTGGFKSIVLPDHIRQVILAPDGDQKGQAVIQKAANRLAGQGREVRAAKLPAGQDWCDVLDSYEERAGILEFDAELIHPEAEAQARREAING